MRTARGNITLFDITDGEAGSSSRLDVSYATELTSEDYSPGVREVQTMTFTGSLADGTPPTRPSALFARAWKKRNGTYRLTWNARDILGVNPDQTSSYTVLPTDSIDESGAEFAAALQASLRAATSGDPLMIDVEYNADTNRFTLIFPGDGSFTVGISSSNWLYNFAQDLHPTEGLNEFGLETNPNVSPITQYSPGTPGQTSSITLTPPGGTGVTETLTGPLTTAEIAGAMVTAFTVPGWALTDSSGSLVLTADADGVHSGVFTLADADSRITGTAVETTAGSAATGSLGSYTFPSINAQGMYIPADDTGAMYRAERTVNYIGTQPAPSQNPADYGTYIEFGGAAGDSSRLDVVYTNSLGTAQGGAAETQTLTFSGQVNESYEGTAESFAYEFTGGLLGEATAQPEIQSNNISGFIPAANAGVADVQTLAIPTISRLRGSTAGVNEVQRGSFNGLRDLRGAVTASRAEFRIGYGEDDGFTADQVRSQEVQTVSIVGDGNEQPAVPAAEEQIRIGFPSDTKFSGMSGATGVKVPAGTRQGSVIDCTEFGTLTDNGMTIQGGS